MWSDKNEEFREVSYDEAIDEAAKILAISKRPLLYGWASTSCAIHEKGMPSATLGQIKNRSDVIVFWGCNPVQAHPRHMSRYLTFARGFFTEKGRRGRKIISVDVRKTHTAGVAAHFPANEDDKGLLEHL